MLLALTPEAPGDPSRLNASYQKLRTCRAELEAAINQLMDWKKDQKTASLLADIKDLDATYLTMAKGTDGSQHRRFEVFAQMYELADTKLIKKTSPAPPGTSPLADAF